MAYTPQGQGAQKPEKYPFTGATYAHYGEQPGFKYDPYRDAYYPDKAAAQQFYQQQGDIPPGAPTQTGPDGRQYAFINGQWVDKTPKAPGLLEQVAPLGAAALAVEGGKQLGAGLLSGGISMPSIGGLLGSGTAPVTAGANTALGGATLGSGASIGAQGGVAGSGLGASSLGTTAATTGAETTGAATGSGVLGLGAAPLGAAAAGIGATLAGRDWARNQGGNTETGWGLLNAMNPINQAAEAFGSVPKALKGDKISMGAGLALAIPTMGLSMLPALFGNEHKWKTEGNRLKKLSKSGADIPQGLLDALPTGGRSFDSMQRKDQAADFIGFDDKGAWVNNKFNQSRNVADLRGTDLQGYAAFAENDPEWFKKSLEERTRIAQGALDAGAVKEHHGTIDVDWKKYQPAAAAPAPGAAAMPKGKPATPMDQGSPGMRPKKNQGRPKQSMQR